MSFSSNQRRAMPVVTMMTFHDRRLGRGFTLAIDDADLQAGGSKDLLGNRADRERLPRAGTRDDAESLAGPRQLANARAVMLLEERLDVEAERQLDRLARRARRRDDDDAPGRRLGANERVVIGREPVVVNGAGWTHAPRRCKDDAAWGRRAATE